MSNAKDNKLKEYPKKVKDPDGNLIRVKNAVQEACVKKGEPFPEEEQEKPKKPEGPREYPKNIEIEVEVDGEKEMQRRRVRCKEEEHALRNGEDWEPPKEEVQNAIKKESGPVEYPKVLMIDGERVKVRNKAEELAALGEDTTDDDTNNPDVSVDYTKMKKKDDLENYALELFGVDLDKRKKVDDLKADIAEIIEKRREAAEKGSVILDLMNVKELADYAQETYGLELDAEMEKETMIDAITEAMLNAMDEAQLVEFAKENYDVELDVEIGKEKLIEAIFEAAEDDDLGLDD